MYRYTTRPRTEVPPFDRDGPTVLGYAALGAYAFWLYAFGPALALLRSELHFSYTVLGGYSALWSGGAALVGASFAAVARRLPRTVLLWSSAAGATVGAGLFACGRTVVLTMLGAVVLGFAGTTLLTCVQAVLSDRHGAHRDRALTEANVGAGACAVLAPLVLGLIQATPAGWRAGMALPALVLAGLFLRYRHQPLPTAPVATNGASRRRLPFAAWLLAVLVAVGIAVEFCVVYFGTELLTDSGLATARAATAMSVFYLGILGGRVGGAVLTRRAGRTARLLWVSMAVMSAGSLLFWLSDVPVPAIVGLFLFGLGVANLYPLSLALTLAAAPGHGDAANARTQLLGGVLVVAAPYLLGTLADHIGLRAAFTIEPVLIVASALLLVIGLRASRS